MTKLQQLKAEYKSLSNSAMMATGSRRIELVKEAKAVGKKIKALEAKTK